MALKMNAERKWCLNWWSGGGWSIGRPISRGIKKWEAHIAWLIKNGLLEPDAHDSELCRLTDPGLAALDR